jgi:hypothetical protein
VKYIDSNKGVKQEKEDHLDNSPISKNQRGTLLKFFLYGKSFIPFLLSHHPECKKFKGHTLNIGRYKLCIGCFVGYPAAFIAILLIPFLNLHNKIPSQSLITFGLIFLATFVLSPLNLTKIKTIKIIQKILIGFGAALLFWGIMTSPNPRTTNKVVSLLVIMILISLLNVYHVYGLFHICYKCKTPFDWGKCPGFQRIRDNFVKESLSNFLIKLEDFSNSIKKKREKIELNNNI